MNPRIIFYMSLMDTITTTTTLFPVYIDLCVSDQTNGSGQIQVTARARDISNNPISINTSVSIDFTWNGDLSGTISDTITISSGNSCVNQTFETANIGENYSSGSIDNITPSSYSGQSYNTGNITNESGGCSIGC